MTGNPPELNAEEPLVRWLTLDEWANKSVDPQQLRFQGGLSVDRVELLAGFVDSSLCPDPCWRDGEAFPDGGAVFQTSQLTAQCPTWAISGPSGNVIVTVTRFFATEDPDEPCMARPGTKNNAHALVWVELTDNNGNTVVFNGRTPKTILLGLKEKVPKFLNDRLTPRCDVK
jgi:hypothetical protein